MKNISRPCSSNSLKYTKIATLLDSKLNVFYFRKKYSMKKEPATYRMTPRLQRSHRLS